MMCWRINLRRKLTAYIHGSLSLDSIKRIESHLMECESCRVSFFRIKEADHMAGRLSGVTARPINSWKAIESIIQKRSQSSTPEIGYFVKALTGVAAALFAVLAILIFSRVMADLPNQKRDLRFDPGAYHPISLSQFPKTVEPHVATEGYVSQISVNDEDGDLMFKLVDDLHRPNHFVVCEIISPYKLELPSPGSRIRVYGVSRYDGKAEHQWFEVHPVLNIVPIR
jgi:Putative zinc-finger